VPRDRRRGAGSMRRLLVVSQVALSVVLLVGAALFIRTLAAATAVKSGYDVDRVLLTTVDFSVPKPGAAAALRMIDRAIDEVSAIPGVEAASFGQIVPFSGAFIGRTAVPEGQPATPPFPASTDAPYTVISPGYFRTLGLPLRGRDFARTDDDTAPRVVVINETMARRFWPNEEAVGKRLRLPLREPGPLYDVIGVVQDGKYRSLTEAQYPYLYLPLKQSFRARVTLHVRTSGAPAGYAAQVRAVLRTVAPDLPAYNVVTLEERVTRSLARERLIARLLTVFGIIALAIAAVGIYGVLAYSVARRTRELGVRMALGARSIDIIRIVVVHSLALVGAGLVTGVVAALLLTRLIATLLFGVTPTDPIAFAGAITVLALVALAATYLPARRATRVDPLTALRAE
jgi:predicted permease